MPLDGVTQAEVSAVVFELNQRPRKRLGRDAPDQVFETETKSPGQVELWYKSSRQVLH